MLKKDEIPKERNELPTTPSSETKASNGCEGAGPIVISKSDSFLNRLKNSFRRTSRRGSSALYAVSTPLSTSTPIKISIERSADYEGPVRNENPFLVETSVTTTKSVMNESPFLSRRSVTTTKSVMNESPFLSRRSVTTTKSVMNESPFLSRRSVMTTKSVTNESPFLTESSAEDKGPVTNESPFLTESSAEDKGPVTNESPFLSRRSVMTTKSVTNESPFLTKSSAEYKTPVTNESPLLIEKSAEYKAPVTNENPVVNGKSVMSKFCESMNMFNSFKSLSGFFDGLASPRFLADIVASYNESVKLSSGDVHELLVTLGSLSNMFSKGREVQHLIGGLARCLDVLEPHVNTKPTQGRGSISSSFLSVGSDRAGGVVIHLAADIYNCCLEMSNAVRNRSNGKKLSSDVAEDFAGRCDRMRLALSVYPVLKDFFEGVSSTGMEFSEALKNTSVFFASVKASLGMSLRAEELKQLEHLVEGEEASWNLAEVLEKARAGEVREALALCAELKPSEVGASAHALLTRVVGRQNAFLDLPGDAAATASTIRGLLGAGLLPEERRRFAECAEGAHNPEVCEWIRDIERHCNDGNIEAARSVALYTDEPYLRDAVCSIIDCVASRKAALEQLPGDIASIIGTLKEHLGAGLTREGVTTIERIINDPLTCSADITLLKDIMRYCSEGQFESAYGAAGRLRGEHVRRPVLLLVRSVSQTYGALPRFFGEVREAVRKGDDTLTKVRELLPQKTAFFHAFVALGLASAAFACVGVHKFREFNMDGVAPMVLLCLGIGFLGVAISYTGRKSSQKASEEDHAYGIPHAVICAFIPALAFSAAAIVAGLRIVNEGLVKDISPNLTTERLCIGIGIGVALLGACVLALVSCIRSCCEEKQFNLQDNVDRLSDASVQNSALVGRTSLSRA